MSTTAPAISTPQASSDGNSWVSFLQALWIRRRLAAAIGIPLALLAAAITWFAFPAEYTARALLRCRFSRPALLETTHSKDKEETAQTQRNMIALVRSPKVLVGAVSAERVRDLPLISTFPDPINWLGTNLRAGFNDDTEYLTLTLSGLHPAEQAAILNAVVESFRAEVNDDARKQLLTQTHRLDSAIADTKIAILKQRDELARLTQGFHLRGGNGNDPEQQLQIATIAALTTDLIKLQAELRRAKDLRDLAKNNLELVRKTPVGKNAIETVLTRHPGILLLNKQLEDALEQIAERANKGIVPENDPLLPRLKAKAETVKIELQKIRKVETETITQSLYDQSIALADVELAQSERNVALLTKQEEALRVELDRRQITPNAPLPPEVELRRKEVEQLEDLFKALKDKREKLSFELRNGDELDTVLVVNSATPPAVADVRAQIIRTAGAAIGTAVLALLSLGFWEKSRRRIRTREEVSSRLGLRVIGTLPEMGSRKVLNEIEWSVPSSSTGTFIVDHADSIRTVLMNTNRPGGDTLPGRSKCRVIVVTSAGPTEGKSVLAHQLAASLVRAGKRTVLVDADLRRPNLHNVLRTADRPGLSEIMTENLPAIDVVQHPSPGLGFIPAGLNCDEGLKNVGRADHSIWIGELLKEYDVVVMDTPPVLSAPDGLIFGRVADGVLLAVRSGVSQAEDVGQASRLLEEVGCHVLGAVLNGVPMSRSVYDYRTRRPEQAFAITEAVRDLSEIPFAEEIA
jgi:succinoglycan biosynthesis transport protein ExoP